MKKTHLTREALMAVVKYYEAVIGRTVMYLFTCLGLIFAILRFPTNLLLFFPVTVMAGLFVLALLFEILPKPRPECFACAERTLLWTPLFTFSSAALSAWILYETKTGNPRLVFTPALLQLPGWMIMIWCIWRWEIRRWFAQF